MDMSTTTTTTTPTTAVVRSSPMAKMESVLLQTLNDYHVRSEVEVCLNSMLLDVETTYHLRQQLQLLVHEQQVDRLAKEQKATVLEADAERMAGDAQRLELADELVQELIGLSCELESLVQWKKQHEHKVETYDELVAKLAQTEEELQEANRVSYGGGPIPRRPSNDEVGEETTKPLDSSDAADLAASAEDDQTPGEPKPEATTPSEGESKVVKASAEEDKKPAAEPTVVAIPPSSETVVELPPPSSDTTTGTVVDNPEETLSDNAASSAEAPPSPPAAVVVALDDDEPEEEVPGLAEVDMEILISIFGFMDAIDILNTAQISLAMYTQVDNIFGISEDGQSPPKAPTPPPPKALAAAKKPPAPAPQPQPTVAKPPAPKPQPTVVVPPPAKIVPAADLGPLGLGLLARLQQPRTAAATASTTTGKRAAESSRGGGPPLNASVAQSMASKLSDAELAAIISMTDKLSKMEKEVHLLRNEKEALSAKLDGTEAVKQFLIGKVRDVDLKLNRSKEEEIKVTQQISSDQEVISFLDTRVQDLERVSDDVSKERNSAQKELQSLKVSTSKKISMLSDMLKYEREKLKDEESEWKATKKVLVKEVKSCRGQILALQAERDGYKEQNDMLKRAIVSTGKTSTAAASPNR
jgi:hypothetical protein